MGTGVGDGARERGLSLGTEGWKAGGSERFDDARIRKALERARRLHISVDGLEADGDLDADVIDDAEIEAPAGPPTEPGVELGAEPRPPGPRGPSNGRTREALRPSPPPSPEPGPWWAAAPAAPSPSPPAAGSVPPGGPVGGPGAPSPSAPAVRPGPPAGPAGGPAAPHTTPPGPPAGTAGAGPGMPAGGPEAPRGPFGPSGGTGATESLAGSGRAYDDGAGRPAPFGPSNGLGAAGPAAGPAGAATQPAPAVGAERGRPTWAADPAAPGEARTGWARRVEAWLPDLAAAAVASGALVVPWLWLLVVTGLTLAVAVMVAGAAGIGVGRLPVHGLRRLLALLHPRSLLWAPVITARTVILAILLPASAASAAWVLDEGSLGLAAAARAGAWTHALRVAAALVCFMLVRGVGPGRARRADAVRKRLSEATDGTLGALALLCVAVTVVVAGVVPRVDRERLSGADGLAWLPPALRSPADRLRDRVVTTELDAVATCLTRRQPTGWNRDYTSGNAPGDVDVGELVVARGEPVPADVVTAVTAAHNQLAPWVETIEVTWDGSTVAQVDRSRLPHGHPVTDATRVVRAATAGRSLLEQGAPDLDRSTVLHCSAGPVL